MFGTTKAFLDYFSLKKLEDLPPLADLSDWESLRVQLNLPEVEDQSGGGAEFEADAAARDLPILYGEEDADSEVKEDKPHLTVLTSSADPESEAEEDLKVSDWPDSVG
jgi:segregation and condensation protein B